MKLELSESQAGRAPGFALNFYLYLAEQHEATGARRSPDSALPSEIQDKKRWEARLCSPSSAASSSFPEALEARQLLDVVGGSGTVPSLPSPLASRASCGGLTEMAWEISGFFLLPGRGHQN